MPRYFSLRDMVTSTVDQAISLKVSTLPAASPLAAQGSIPLTQANAVGDVLSTDFRWGFSVWGVDTITTEMFPTIFESNSNS